VANRHLMCALADQHCDESGKHESDDYQEGRAGSGCHEGVVSRKPANRLLLKCAAIVATSAIAVPRADQAREM